MQTLALILQAAKIRQRQTLEYMVWMTAIGAI